MLGDTTSAGNIPNNTKLRPIPTPKKIREAQAMVSDAIDILEPQLKNEKFGPALLSLMKIGKMVTA